MVTVQLSEEQAQFIKDHLRHTIEAYCEYYPQYTVDQVLQFEDITNLPDDVQVAITILRQL